MLIGFDNIPQTVPIAAIVAASGILAAVLLLRRRINRRLLLYEWRYYSAFKYICSRTTHRHIEDVADLSFLEKIILFRRYKEKDFSSLQDHLDRKSEDDPTLIRNSFSDHLVLLRTVVKTIRRLLYVGVVLFALRYVAGLLNIQIPLPSPDAHHLFFLFATMLIILTAYTLYLLRRIRQLRKNYPLAYREQMDAQGIRKCNRLSKMELLAIRPNRDYRIRQDSHAPIARQFSRIVRDFPLGCIAYLSQLQKTDEELSHVAESLSKAIAQKTPTDALLAKMHDDLYLQAIQLCNWNSERIVLLNNHPKTDNIPSVVATRQGDVFQLAHELRNSRVPNWQFIPHDIPFQPGGNGSASSPDTLRIPEMIFRDLSGEEEPKEEDIRDLLDNIQTLLYFAGERLQSRHMRIVVTSATTRAIPGLTPSSLTALLQKRGFNNVQQDYADLNLRKSSDPSLVVFLIRLSTRSGTFDEILSQLLTSTPMNLICITPFRILTPREHEVLSEHRQQDASTADLRLATATKDWERLSSLPCLSLYRFTPPAFDGTGYEPTADDLDVRSLLAHLKKHGLENPEAAYVNALARLVQKSFGKETGHLTLFPVPTSRAVSYRTKFERLTAVLCAKTGMDNAYSHLRYIKDFTPQRPHEQGQPSLSIDWNYLAGRNLLLFDDIVSNGKSSSIYARILREHGVNVVALLAIARSKAPGLMS